MVQIFTSRSYPVGPLGSGLGTGPGPWFVVFAANKVIVRDSVSRVKMIFIYSPFYMKA